MSKYYNQRTYSQVCNMIFASKLKANRAEELTLLEKCGVISDLSFQVPYKLCSKPRVSIVIDFAYIEDGKMIFEDTKGFLTREARVKLAWLKEKYGIDVKLIRK